jgi:hypothetical protein
MSTINIGGKELNDAIFQVLRRASVDPQFRELALRDGNEAIAKIKPNVEGTDNLEVRFVDKSDSSAARMTITFVLPEAVEAGELSEAELEAVAGGALATKQAHGIDIQT